MSELMTNSHNHRAVLITPLGACTVSVQVTCTFAYIFLSHKMHLRTADSRNYLRFSSDPIGSIQPTALDELGSTCTAQAEQLSGLQIASIQLRCLDDAIPSDHDLYTLLCSENQIYTVLGAAACFDACQLRNALACLQMQCWHTHGHRQSARTTQALNVKNWPWVYIWKTHSKQNWVLVLCWPMAWPPDYAVIWNWFPF